MSYYTHSGNLQPDAPSYVRRAADEEVFEAIRRGEFCYVLTASQMGKSSLMVRTKARLEREGRRVTVFSLESVGSVSIENPEQLYFGILDRIGVNLGVEDELVDYWDSIRHLRPLQRLLRCLAFAARTAPKAGSQPHPHPLVIMIDEVGLVRRLGFSTGELFGAIRESHSPQPDDPAAPRLTFCLLGTATPSELVDDPALSPFHIGRRIDLQDFTLEEAMQFTRGFIAAGVEPGAAERFVRRIYYWTNGHPGLTQRFCGWVVERCLPRRDGSDSSPAPIRNPAACVDKLCRDLFFTNNPRQVDETLASVQDRLLRTQPDRADLLDLYQKIRDGHRIAADERDPLGSQLLLSGIVRVEKGRLVTRNRIYRRAFDREWVRSNMPQAELRRQREAWQRGVALATALSFIVVAVIGLLFSQLLLRIRRERLTWASSQVTLARYIRVAVQNGTFARQAPLTGLTLQPQSTHPRRDSLAALSNAVAHYADRVELANEIAASLALPDLQVVGAPTASNAMGSAFSSGIPRSWISEAAYQPVHDSHAQGTITAVRHRATGSLLLSFPGPVSARGVALRADSHQLAVCQPDVGIQLYELSGTNVSEGKSLRPQNSRWTPAQIAFQPNGAWLASASSNSSVVRIWNPATLNSRLLDHSADVLDLAWHPSGRVLAVATAKPTVYLHLVTDPDLVQATPRDHWMEFDASMTLPSSIAFNHRGDTVAVLDNQRRVCLWMPWAGIRLAFPLTDRPFDSLQFTADDQRLEAHCRRTGLCQTWEVIGGEYLALHPLTDPTEGALDLLSFNQDGRLLIAGTSSGLALIDMQRLAWSRHIPVNKAASVFFQSNGVGLVIASHESGLQTISLTGPGTASPTGAADSREPLAITLDGEAVGAAASLPDNRIVVALPTKCQVVEAGKGTLQYEFSTGVTYDQLVASEQGRWLAGRLAGTPNLALWNLSNRQAPHDVKSAGSHFAFSPDERWLFFTSHGLAYAIRLDPSAVASPPIQLAGAEGLSGPIAVGGPAGAIALVEQDSRVSLYRFTPGDPPTVARALSLETPEASKLVRLRFSPNGRRLIGVDGNQTLHIWSLDRIEAGLKARQLPIELFTARVNGPHKD